MCDRCSQNKLVLHRWLEEAKPHTLRETKSPKALRVCLGCYGAELAASQSTPEPEPEREPASAPAAPAPQAQYYWVWNGCGRFPRRPYEPRDCKALEVAYTEQQACDDSEQRALVPVGWEQVPRKKQVQWEHKWEVDIRKMVQYPQGKRTKARHVKRIQAPDRFRWALLEDGCEESQVDWCSGGPEEVMRQLFECLARDPGNATRPVLMCHDQESRNRRQPADVALLHEVSCEVVPEGSLLLTATGNPVHGKPGKPTAIIGPADSGSRRRFCISTLRSFTDGSGVEELRVGVLERRSYESMPDGQSWHSKDGLTNHCAFFLCCNAQHSDMRLGGQLGVPQRPVRQGGVITVQRIGTSLRFWLSEKCTEAPMSDSTPDGYLELKMQLPPSLAYPDFHFAVQFFNHGDAVVVEPEPAPATCHDSVVTARAWIGEMYELHERAATKLQTFWRARTEAKDVNLKHQAATKLQTRWRARSKAKDANLKHHAALKLQAFWRQHCSRREELKLRRQAHCRETVQHAGSVIVFIVCCVGFAKLASGAVESTTTVNGTIWNDVPSRGNEGSADFIVWLIFECGDLILRAFTLLSLVLFTAHLLSRALVQGIQACDLVERRLRAQIAEQKQDIAQSSSGLGHPVLGPASEREPEPEADSPKASSDQRRTFEAVVTPAAVIKGILTAASCAFAWLPGRSADVEVEKSAQTSLRMFAVLSLSFLLWMGELLSRRNNWYSLNRVGSSSGAVPPKCASLCAGGKCNGEESSLQRSKSTNLWADFKGEREDTCLPKRWQRYKKHDGEYVRDIFLVKERLDRAEWLARKHSDAAREHMAEESNKAMRETLRQVQQLRAAFLLWGRWLIPGVAVAQWVNAVLQATVGFLLVMWSGWLALDNRQWQFSHHFEDQNFRAATVPAIGLGVICAAVAVFRFFQPQPVALRTGGGVHPVGHRGQLADIVDEAGPLGQRLMQVQIFGSLVILVAKLLYWVCKDNFSGVLTSDLDEDLVLAFATLVVWWVICIVSRLPARAGALLSTSTSP